MNTHLKQLWAAMRLPKNFKKSYKFFCLGLDIRVAQIVKANPAQTILFQQLRKACCHGIRLDQISHCIHKYITEIFLVIAVAADFLVVFLLLFDGF